MKNLKPSTQAKNHIGEGGEVQQAMYRWGNPRQYRFNAGIGVLNINGLNNITKPGQSFKIMPIALRIFKDALFIKAGKPAVRKTWAEIAFLNESNQVCMMLLHNYSVENLIALESELYYDQVKFTDIVLEIKPQEKESKNPEAENATYYICDFDFEPASEDVLTAQREAIKNMPIYRMDTVTEKMEMLLTANYPTELVQQALGTRAENEAATNSELAAVEQKTKAEAKAA